MFGILSMPRGPSGVRFQIRFTGIKERFTFQLQLFPSRMYLPFNRGEDLLGFRRELGFF